MMRISDLERMQLVSWKKDKQIYANGAEGYALSVLRLPDRRSLDAQLEQRKALLAAAGDCPMLNLPRNPIVQAQDQGFLLIEEMDLCSAAGCDERWADDLMEAIRQLHAAGWVHLDLKPEHLLYGSGCWKLHDFDGAMPVGKSFRERDITWAYAPPDVLWYNRAQRSDDLYAAALMIYRRCNGGKLPFERESENRAALKRYLWPLIPVPEAWGNEARRFFRKALSWNRSRRFHSTEAFIEAYKHVELMLKAGE